MQGLIFIFILPLSTNSHSFESRIPFFVYYSCVCLLLSFHPCCSHRRGITGEIHTSWMRFQFSIIYAIFYLFIQWFVTTLHWLNSTKTSVIYIHHEKFQRSHVGHGWLTRNQPMIHVDTRGRYAGDCWLTRRNSELRLINRTNLWKTADWHPETLSQNTTKSSGELWADTYDHRPKHVGDCR